MCRSGRRVFAGLVVALAVAAPAEAAPLTLERVVALALERNERPRVSEAQAEAARYRVDRARTFFFPDFAITGTYTRRLHETTRTINDQTVVIQRHDALAMQANLTVPLFDARLFPLYRQAKLEGESAALTAAQARRLLAFEAADAFLMVLGQQQVVDAAARREEFARQSLRDARARAEAGLVSSNDVTKGALEAANAERERGVQSASATTARLELGFLLDLDVGDALASPDALLAEAALAPEALPALLDRALAARLDVKAGELRSAALAAAAQEPKRRAIPSLAAVGQYRVTNESGLAGRQRDGFAGLVATWAPFDGGERRAEARERGALARAEEATQATRVRAVGLDVRRARVALESAQALQTSAVDAASIARRNVTETAELYRQGLGRALEVADASLRLFEAEVALARQRYALLLAYLDLKAATGAPAPGQPESSR